MKVCWSRRALADLNRIAAHIAKDKPPAAIRFAQMVQQQVENLSVYPLPGRSGAYQDTRELVVHKNYLITYRLRGDEVQVLQVWHVARGLPRG